jgi:hypothetical protein
LVHRWKGRPLVGHKWKGRKLVGHRWKGRTTGETQVEMEDNCWDIDGRRENCWT